MAPTTGRSVTNGNTVTIYKCLRTNANMLTNAGAEGEYDGPAADEGALAVEGVAELLSSVRLRSLVDAAPSYEPGVKERWRILAPLAREQPPSERAALVARLNGLTNGKLTDESFSR